MNKPLRNLKYNLLLIVGFILTSVVGMTAIETVKVMTARSMSYEDVYHPGWGRFVFYPSDEAEFNYSNKSLEDLNQEEKLARVEGNRTQFLINISGGVLVMFTTAFGYILLMRGRRREDDMHLVNWIGFFLSIVMFRYTIIHAIGAIFRQVPCTEGMAFWYVGNSVYLTLYVLLVLELVIAGWITTRLPVKQWLPTIIAGIFGGFVGGFYIWAQDVGPWLEILLQ